MKFSVLILLCAHFFFIPLSNADSVYAICYGGGNKVIFELEEGSFTEFLEVNPGRMTHMTSYAGGTGIVSLSASSFSISGTNPFYSTEANVEINKLKKSVTIKTSKDGNPEVTKVLNCNRLETNY